MSAKRICIEKDQQTSDDGDKEQKVVINSLDYDSLAKIISLLPIPEIMEMKKVCTKWKEACQLAWYNIKEYKCESSIGRSYDNRLLTQSYLEKILLRCGKYLNELSLSDVCKSSIMPFVGDHCKNLTTLECKFHINTLHYYADNFVQAFTQLHKLKCIKITLDQLKSLKITIDHNKSDYIFDLYEIINSLPEEMNEIHLFSKSLQNQKQDFFMTFKRFKNLKKLTLHGIHLDNIILQEIAEMTTLVHLNIESLYIPKWLNKLVNLEYIDLTMGTQYNHHFSTEILNTIFCTCKNLKHLDIPRGPYDLAKIPYEKWINFKNIQYLGIACDMMPELANTIVEYCKNLKHLKIHYPRGIINKTALKKLTELENLECIISVGFNELHEESIIAISKNCKKLKRFEIPLNYIVPSIHTEPLSSPSVLDELSKLQCLEHLDLSYVKNLNDSTITGIANNCKNIKTLGIANCPAISETGLCALTNMENLQKLNVSYLDTITDSFLIKLKGLKELNCSYCQKLTNSGIIQFIKNNPDLEMIDVRRIKNITIDMVIAADQVTENRTNGIILQIRSLKKVSNSIIKSQWLVVDCS